MILTTPAQERYRRFSCPNPACRLCNQPNADNVVHRSWTGKHKHIERLRCTICGCEFAERQGPLMARSKLPEATVEQLLKCQRWGVCDEGMADICAVDLKTVPRFQRVAAQRAVTHHWQSVQAVAVQGVQLDEAHAKLRPKQVEWVHTALAMGSWFFPVGRLWTADSRDGSHAARSGRRAHPADTALSHGRVEGLYRGAAPGRGGGVSSPPTWESGPQAQAAVGGSESLVLRPGGEVPQQGGPGGGRPQASGVRWPAPFCQAVVSAAARGDDPDRLYGTLVWDATGTGGVPAAPHPVSILEPQPPPGQGLAHGQSLQLCAAP